MRDNIIDYVETLFNEVKQEKEDVKMGRLRKIKSGHEISLKEDIAYDLLNIVKEDLNE